MNEIMQQIAFDSTPTKITPKKSKLEKLQEKDSSDSDCQVSDEEPGSHEKISMVKRYAFPQAGVSK